MSAPRDRGADLCSAGLTSFAQLAAPTGTPPGPSVSDSGLSPATSYSYRVRATDLAGNLSGYSEEVGRASWRARELTAEDALTGLAHVAIRETQASLSWL